MVNRSYVVIESDTFPTAISIYTHWLGEDNLTVVKNVLAFTDRIGDASYLTAQITYALMQASPYDGKLSVGIDPVDRHSMDYGWGDAPTVFVNADTGHFTYQDTRYDRWGNQIDPVIEAL